MHENITRNSFLFREKDVSDLYREYWTLSGIYELYLIYNEIKNDIWSIIELHRRMKEEKLNRDQVCKILKTTETLEHNNRILEDEQYRLKQSNKHAAELFQHFTNLRLEDNKIIEKNDGVIRNQRLEIETLQDEKVRLQHTVVNFMMDCLNNNIPLPPSEKSNLQMQVHQPEPGLELKS